MNGEPSLDDPARGRPSTGVRVLIAVVAAVVAVLLVEGATSLVRGKGVIAGLRSDPLEDWAALLQTDAERNRAAASLPGIFRAHEDPFVRYSLKADAKFEVHRVTASTDSLGVRKRPAGAIPDGALRVVVLGDSVAFGFGVKDDETLACALERELARASRAGARQVACTTVAAPGWNHRQSVRFLLDHLDALRPDVVLFIPISNDLYDAEAVAESGHRFMAPDPAQLEPLLLANSDAASHVVLGLAAQRRRSLGERAANSGRPATGTEAMTSYLSPESRHRYAANAQSLLDLEAALAPTNGKLFVLRYIDDDYAAVLRSECVQRGLRAQWVPLLGRFESAFTLGDDPHPSARTLQALARIAAETLGPALIGAEFDAAALSDLPEAYAKARSYAAPDAVEARAARARTIALDALEPAFDTSTAQGSRQVYGGVNPDGTLGLRATFLLKRAGPTLRVHLQSMLARPDLYPLDVEILAGDAQVATLTVPRPEERLDAVAEVTLPAEIAPAIEVTLVPSRHAVIPFAGKRENAAATIVRIEVR